MLTPKVILLRDFAENGETVYFLSNFDDALLGISSDNKVCYSMDAVLDILCGSCGGDEDKAMDEFDKMNEAVGDDFVFIWVPYAS